jgi:hypothetical protein
MLLLPSEFNGISQAVVHFLGNFCYSAYHEFAYRESWYAEGNLPPHPHLLRAAHAEVSAERLGVGSAVCVT